MTVLHDMSVNALMMSRIYSQMGSAEVYRLPRCASQHRCCSTERVIYCVSRPEHDEIPRLHLRLRKEMQM